MKNVLNWEPMGDVPGKIHAKSMWTDELDVVAIELEYIVFDTVITGGDDWIAVLNDHEFARGLLADCLQACEHDHVMHGKVKLPQ